MTILQIRARMVRKDSVVAMCALLIGTMSLSACADAVVTPVAAAERFDGETLYRGIFFGQGAVAAAIPEIQAAIGQVGSIEPAQREALNTFADDMVRVIRATEPGFFAEFEAAMHSGDHREIERTLNRANRLSVESLDQIPAIADWRAQLAANREAVQAELLQMYNAGQMSRSEFESARAHMTLMLAAQSDLDPQVGPMDWWRGWVLAVCVALAAAVALPPAIGVALVVAAAYAWAWSPSTETAGSTLHKEQVIDALATRLAVDFF